MFSDKRRVTAKNVYEDTLVWDSVDVVLSCKSIDHNDLNERRTNDFCIYTVLKFVAMIVSRLSSSMYLK